MNGDDNDNNEWEDGYPPIAVPAWFDSIGAIMFIILGFCVTLETIAQVVMWLERR